MTQTYQGGCQCGKVSYEVALELGEVIACNCSRCKPMGFRLAFASPDNFKLKSGADATTEYQFNKHVIHHLFCATCGVQSYATGKRPDGADVVAINVRCLEGVDADALKVRHVDGRKF
jgi:hypothetical protein